MPGPTAREDLYERLGVSRDASDDEIKQAYRKLARRWHPDVSEEPDAEERFKQISEANAVLSDATRRAAYDEFGEISLDPGFDAEQARAARQFGGGSAGFSFQTGAEGGLEDWLGELFGGFGAEAGSRGGAVRGPDLQSGLTLGFEQAAFGGVFQLSLAPAGGGPNRDLQVRIPPGVRDGGKIRLRGQGAPSPFGGEAGDLVVTVRVRPHRHFRREGRDLHLEVPITLVEATLGADVEVPTLDGRAKVRVPEGTDGGTRLRLRGKGIPGAQGSPAGDLYVKVRICVPKIEGEEDRAEIERLARFGPIDPRADLLA